jgi:hypothetical protein
MNRHDFILIGIILLITLLLFVPKFISDDKASTAYVYYDNHLIKKIDLSIDKSNEYIVKGYNGDVVIETEKNKIRVKKETSPLNLCSKQGWVTSSLESIVCLPNKIVIKMESTKTQVDAVVR